MRCVIRVDENGNRRYYAGYHPGGIPAGFILSEAIEDAVVFPDRSFAENVLNGDERFPKESKVEYIE